MRNFKGKDYVLEESIWGDYSLIKAQKADKYGNLVFNKTARNFNADMALAGKTVIAEVEEIVENGELDPDLISVPGVFVHRVFKSKKNEKPIEKLTVSNAQQTQVGSSVLREKILRRAAKEVKNGMYVNLGIGIPTSLPSVLPKDIKIELHSENGVLGVGNYPE